MKTLNINGFSLLESLLVLAGIGVLAALAIHSHHEIVRNSRTSKLVCDTATVNHSIAAYLANGGSLAGVTSPERIIDKLKTTRDSVSDARYVGFSGATVDQRLAVRMSTPETSGESPPRAVWNSTKQRFEIASSGTGVVEFYLDDAKGRIAYGTEARQSSVLSYNTASGWIWNHVDSSPMQRPAATLVPIAGIPTTSAQTTGPAPESWEEPVRSVLLPPIFSLPGGTYAPSLFPVQLRLSNPNPSEDTRIFVSMAGEPFFMYSSPLAIPANATVAAFVTGDPYLWTPSPTVAATYLRGEPIALLAPQVTTSHAQFDWESAALVSVTLQNPNNAETSALQYQMNGASWQTYLSPLELAAANFPNGATIAARAIPLTPDYLTSPESAAHVAAPNPPVTLLAPQISPSAPNFVAGAVETIVVALTNPNLEGSALEYRLSGSSTWLAYSAPFSVAQASYPSGLNVEARARSVSPAYIDSSIALCSIGVTPVQLQTPAITSSAPNFIVGSVESISISISDPNTAGSALEYRLNAGSWTAYSGTFSANLTTYPSGVTVEARARATSPAYTDSGVASASLGLVAPELVLLLDEDALKKDTPGVLNASSLYKVSDEMLVNETTASETGNPWLGWNQYPGHEGDLYMGQPGDEGWFALPATLPWPLKDFLDGTIPQSSLDKIPNVQPLNASAIGSYLGQTFTAVVYKSDISINYNPLHANLQGARRGKFKATILSVGTSTVRIRVEAP